MDKFELSGTEIRDLVYANGLLYTTNNVANTPNVGTYQYRNSANQLGTFHPGTYRVNPVVMSKTTSFSTSGAVTMVKSPYVIVSDGFHAAKGTTLASSGPSGMSNRSIPSWDARLASLSHVSAFEKVNSPELFDGATFLGELTETLSMLRKPFTGVRKLLRRKSFSHPKKLIGASADQWLEFRYGISPLANDIAMAASLLHRRSRLAETRIFTLRSTKTKSTPWVGEVIVSTNWGSHTMRCSGTFNEKYTSGVSFYKKPGVFSSLHKYGLSVQSVPALLWELTPYSFVVDWFWQVGPWIRAITPNPSVTVLGSFTTRQVTELGKRVCVKSAYSTGVSPRPSASTYQWKYELLDRRVGSALPVLPVRQIDVANFTRSVDSLSLLWQQLPRPWRQGTRR